MKRMICAALVLLMVFAYSNSYAELNVKYTIVVETEYNTDTALWTIICEDVNGELWAFYDSEAYWKIDDIALLLMNNDEVIGAQAPFYFWMLNIQIHILTSLYNVI